MALGGTYQDHFKDMFRDMLLHEAQEQGSVLAQTVMMEEMSGNKTFFDKLGKVAHYVKTARGQDKTFSDTTNERRQVQEVLASFDHILDPEDLIKFVSDPRSEIVTAAIWELGRRKDEVIIEALQGNSVVTTNGTTANVALPASSKVGVADHTFDAGSGDVGLTTGKLKLAKTILGEKFGINQNERIFCVAPMRQIMNLTTENQQVSGDFRTSKPLEGPGIVNNISGYMGIDFISYEEAGVDASSDERVYVYSASAIKLGIYLPLTVEIVQLTDKVTNPDSISVFEAIGATRMYEEKVVEIACDPLA